MLIRIQNHFDHRVCLGLKRRGQKSLWRRHGEPCSYRDNKVTDRDKITYIYIVDMSDALKSPWIIPPITFYEQYRSCKSLSARARPSACLLGHTDTDRPNLRTTARWRGKALSPSPLFPPLATRSSNYGQLLCARGSPFSRFVRPHPLSAFHSLLPFHPSSVGGSRPQSEASLGRRFCR